MKEQKETLELLGQFNKQLDRQHQCDEMTDEKKQMRNEAFEVTNKLA